jgi:hypothetical protein
MSHNSDARIVHGETPGEAKQRHDERNSPSLGLRAAILAGLIVAAGGGVAAPGISHDLSRMVVAYDTTCCPPNEII